MLTVAQAAAVKVVNDSCRGLHGMGVKNLKVNTHTLFFCSLQSQNARNKTLCIDDMKGIHAKYCSNAGDHLSFVGALATNTTVRNTMRSHQATQTQPALLLCIASSLLWHVCDRGCYFATITLVQNKIADLGRSCYELQALMLYIRDR